MSLSTTKRRHTAAGSLKPGTGTPVVPESAIQADILELLKVGYPDVLVASIPNGGFVLDPRIVQKLRWQGLRPGMPDLVLLWRYVPPSRIISGPDGWKPQDPGTNGVGFIEVKSWVGRLSEDQKSVHAWLTAHGHRVAVVRSTDDLRKTLAEWGAPCRITA